MHNANTYPNVPITSIENGFDDVTGAEKYTENGSPC